MNERIKELAEQANKDLKNKHLDFEEGLMLYSEKFAELIVRECVEVANNHFESKEPGYPGDKIEEHFGVEE